MCISRMRRPLDICTSPFARVRRYVNPFVVFTDGGRLWTCNLCGISNEVPHAYFSPVEGGRRRDHAERVELNKGSVEMVASAEYMARPPQAPVFMFVLDVSYTSVVSGALAAACAAIRAALPSLPGGERTQVGFVTFDAAVHFYSLKAGLAQPAMCVRAGAPSFPVWAPIRRMHFLYGRPNDVCISCMGAHSTYAFPVWAPKRHVRNPGAGTPSRTTRTACSCQCPRTSS